MHDVRSTLSMVNGTGLPKLVRNSFGHCRIKERLFAQELNCKFLRIAELYLGIAGLVIGFCTRIGLCKLS